MTRIFQHPPLLAVQTLLKQAGLPYADLTDRHMEDFFGCGSNDSPDGIVGLELFGKVALLRSLAVAPTARERGHGSALVAQAERHAKSRGAEAVYLLTTTAEFYFQRMGYSRIAREEAPPAILQTQEFSTLCPANSALMVKRPADD